MKTVTIPIGKYMHAEPLLCDPHAIYTIHARDETILGHAEWYPRWLGYVFSPEDGIVLSWDCCLELSRFLENCNKATKVCREKQIVTELKKLHKSHALTGTGIPGQRDPEFPCADFNPGEASYGRCDGDGHFLCDKCEEHSTRLTAEAVDSVSKDSAPIGGDGERS
jgi:hypothetical protein